MQGLIAEELESSIPHPGQVTILQPGELMKYVAVATENYGLDVIEAGILCSAIRIITSNLRYIIAGIQEAFLSYPPSIVDTRGERDNHITNVTFNRVPSSPTHRATYRPPSFTKASCSAASSKGLALGSHIMCMASC